MAKARPSVQKRQKELAKLEKKQVKDLRRQQREENRLDRTTENGVDPDLAGIVPGPQAPPDAFREE